MQPATPQITTMKDWTFFATIRPERCPLRFDFEMISEFADLGLRMHNKIFTWENNSLVDVTVINGTIDVFTLKNIIETTLRRIVDIVGYSNGLRFDVDVISAISHRTDERHVFGYNIPALSKSRPVLDKKWPVLIDFDISIISVLLKEPSLGMILADFREAIRMPHATGFFCYRAIEAIMQSFRCGNDNQTWARMRSALRNRKRHTPPLQGTTCRSPKARQNRGRIRQRQKGNFFDNGSRNFSIY